MTDGKYLRVAILTWVCLILGVVSVQAQTRPLTLAPGECRLITGPIGPRWTDANGKSVDELLGMQASSADIWHSAAAWMGAALITKRGEYWYGAAGGHSASGDNSVWVNALLTDQQWRR